MKKSIAIIGSLLLSATGFSQTFIDGNFTFTVHTTDTVRVTDYNIAGGADVVIPSTTTYNSQTYVVGIIVYQSFMSKNITSVDIPNTVHSIYNGAFLFNQLTSVTLPNSVKIVSPASFGNNQISSIAWSDNLTFLGENAFNGNQLTTLTLPPAITSIAKQTFANNNFTDLVIPDGITSLGEGAFAGNPLSSVTSYSLTPPDIVTAMDISDSFSDDRSAIDLFIPNGTTGAYVTDPGAEWIWFHSVTEMSGVGLSSVELKEGTTIYPNPATEQISIDTDLAVESVEILNTLGGIELKFASLNQYMDISSLSPGVYFVRINAVEGVVIQQIVKK